MPTKRQPEAFRRSIWDRLFHNGGVAIGTGLREDEIAVQITPATAEASMTSDYRSFDERPPGAWKPSVPDPSPSRPPPNPHRDAVREAPRFHVAREPHEWIIYEGHTYRLERREPDMRTGRRRPPPSSLWAFMQGAAMMLGFIAVCAYFATVLFKLFQGITITVG